MGSLDTEVRNYDPDDPPRFGEWVRVDGMQVARKANGNTKAKPEVAMPIPQPPVDMPHRSTPTTPRHNIPIWIWGLVALALILGLAGGVVIANVAGLIWHKQDIVQPRPKPNPPHGGLGQSGTGTNTQRPAPGQTGTGTGLPPDAGNVGGGVGGHTGPQGRPSNGQPNTPSGQPNTPPGQPTTPPGQPTTPPGQNGELPTRQRHASKRHKNAMARAGGGANGPVTAPDTPSLGSPTPAEPKVGAADPSIGLPGPNPGDSTQPGQHGGIRPGEHAMVITRATP